MQPRQTGSDAFVGKLLHRKHVAPLYYCILITVFLLIGLKMTILGRRKKTISALWAERPGAPRVARAGTRRAPVLDARRALGRVIFMDKTNPRNTQRSDFHTNVHANGKQIFS